MFISRNGRESYFIKSSVFGLIHSLHHIHTTIATNSSRGIRVSG